MLSLIFLITLFFIQVTVSISSSPFPSTFQKGIVFGGDEWSSPVYPYGSDGSFASLTALAATGATHVRFLVTGYMDNAHNATQVYSISPPSALATVTVDALTTIISQATSLGLKSVICPVLDPNWDILPAGSRSSKNANFTWRGTIGNKYTSQTDFDNFFQSYRTWVMPYLKAVANNAWMIEVSSELDFLFAAPQAEVGWRSFITDLRNFFPGYISCAVDHQTVLNMKWIDALDFIGLDVYNGLGNSLPLGIAPSVSDLVAAYEANVTPSLEAILALGNVSIIFSETGFQSRPNCHVQPWGSELLDPYDDSAWLLVVDVTCQNNAYEALFRYLLSKPFIHGVYLWMWKADPTTGGTYNGDFTPFAKPAEQTLRRWFGGNITTDGTDALLISRKNARLEPTLEQRIAARNAILPPSPINSLSTFHTPHPKTKRTFNGFCIGTPDEWSSPFYRLGSEGSLTSLDDMIATTAADTVEIIAQWWFDNVNSTEIYPILDAGSPLRTSTDEELNLYIAAAKQRGLKTIFTLMLDPNWLLPEQSHCRDTGNPNCYWRGQVGIFWGNDCSPGSQWANWHAGYSDATLHYAKLAQDAGIDSFLITHELYGPNDHCSDLWVTLTSNVREIFKGSISTVIQNGDTPLKVPWVSNLDYLGIDCYETIPLPSSSVPSYPWSDATLEDLIIAGNKTMRDFAETSAGFGNKMIVCTELGMPSRPHAYTTWGGAYLLDPEDCSVFDQCFSINAQLLTYQWWLNVFYAQPWFDGFLFWHWRADPTAGGMSTDGFTIQGKAPIQQAIKAFWGE
jgi:hypothetical protein